MKTLALTLIALVSAAAMTEGALANGRGKGQPTGEAALCGTIRGLACAEGQWCDLQEGICNGADIAGRCVSVPQVCTLDYRPVCGCDGKTYSNDCARRSAKVQKKQDGPC